MGLRLIENGLPESVRTFATQATARAKAEEYTKGMIGVCNARIVPVEQPGGPNRYTLMFYGFTEMSDAPFLARAGFVVNA